MKCFAVFLTMVSMAASEALLPSLHHHAALGGLPYAGGLGYAGYGNLALGHHGLGYAGLGAAPIAAAGYAAGPVIAAPAPVIAAPAPIAAPIASQYQSQDELGNYQYGYENINSAKHEKGNAYAGVEGSYSYIDSYGLPQKVNYVADALGFRASGTNFPLTAANLGIHRRRREIAGLGYAGLAAPLAPAAYAGLPLAAPAIAAPIDALGLAHPGLAHPGLAHGGYAHAGYAHGGFAHETISAPVARDAILTKIQNNPGFATSYRVD